MGDDCSPTLLLDSEWKQASDRQKAHIEQRIAEVKADYAARSAKLEQARILAKAALSKQGV